MTSKLSLNQHQLLMAGGLVLFLWLSAFALLSNSYLGIIDLWSRSSTYTHGYVVFPISIYLVWRIRAQWQSVEVKPQPLALFFIAGCLGTWLLGVIAGVQALEHLAAVSLLPLLVWCITGNAFTRAIMFPLCFLIFAVPIGDFLIDPMMEFTADFTVAAIRFVGIPVFREGLYFSLPSGNWSVVKACSGVRYIIASLTLGALYAYLTYSHYWKRTVFILFSALVPVIANGLRAVIIVLIGHFSSMKLATGVDHLIYGWVFFGLVMFFMFWVGGYFADPTPNNDKPAFADRQSLSSVPIKKQVIVVFVVLFMMVGIRFWQAEVQAAPGKSELLRLELPQQIGQWQIDNPILDNWKPTYLNPAQNMHASYRQSADQVGLYIAFYPYQNANSELVNSANDIAGEGRQWQVINTSRQRINKFEIVESVLRGNRSEWLMWSWYQTSQGATASTLKAKVYEVWGTLTGSGSAGAGIVVYHELGNDSQATRTIMADFLKSLAPHIAEKPASQLFGQHAISDEANR